MWTPSTCDCECDGACKIGEYLDIKNRSRKKCLFDKLVLACEDEILDTIKTSIVHTKGTYQNNNCLIHTIFLVMIWLLVVTFFSCYYYYAKHW